MYTHWDTWQFYRQGLWFEQVLHGAQQSYGCFRVWHPSQLRQRHTSKQKHFKPLATRALHSSTSAEPLGLVRSSNTKGLCSFVGLSLCLYLVFFLFFTRLLFLRLWLYAMIKPPIFTKGLSYFLRILRRIKEYYNIIYQKVQPISFKKCGIHVYINLSCIYYLYSI